MSSSTKKKPIEDEDDDDDEEDEDYVPNGAEASDEEEEEEDEEAESDIDQAETNGEQIGKRKSETAGLKENGASKSKKKDQDEPKEVSEQKLEEEKKKTDDLWSSFLKDVGRTKSETTTTNTSTSSNKYQTEISSSSSASLENKKPALSTSIKSLFGETKITNEPVAASNSSSNEVKPLETKYELNFFIYICVYLKKF